MMEITTRFLPERKAEYIRNQYARIPKEEQPLAITSYANSSIIPLGYIEDACYHPKDKRLVDDLDLCADIEDAPAEAIIDDACVMYCGYLHYNSWGHFLTNTLARMWPIARRDIKVDKYVFLTRDNSVPDITGNFAEIFSLMGIDEKIEILTQPKAYRKIIVGDLSYALDYKVFPEYVSLIDLIINNALSGYDSTASSKLFITRSALKNANKRDIGIRVIDDFYSSNGFEVVYPERLGIRDLIAKLHSASIVAFISGSGAHNSIFCPKGTEIHILERAALCNIFQPLIEEAFSHKVVYVQSSYSLLPVPYGDGPFLYAITPWFECYASEKGYQLPEIDSKLSVRNFNRYLRLREKRYRFRWWLDAWASDQLDVQLEAYSEAKTIYSAQIGGDGVRYVGQLKRFLKKLIGR